jgi:phage major head subunit gpT-like protein
MPITTNDLPQEALVGLRALFRQTVIQATAEYAKLCEVLESDSDSESAHWLGAIGPYEDWTDELPIRDLARYKFTIQNKRMGKAIQVERTALRVDRLGLLKPKIVELAIRGAQVPDKLVLQKLLLSGFTSKCYDGQFFFDSDHEEEASGVQSNIPGAGEAVFSKANLELAIKKMELIKDGTGEPLGVSPTHLVVGPELKIAARELLNSTTIVIAGDSDRTVPAGNGLSGALELVTTPYITGPQWFLLDLAHAAKPFVFQRVDPPELATVTDINDAHVALKDSLIFRGRTVCNAGYALWQYAFGSLGV